MGQFTTPLRLLLNPFEFYMLSDDRADYPMVFRFQFYFEGSFAVDRLRNAAMAVLPAHPLLTAKRERGKSTTVTGNYWVADTRRELPISVCADERECEKESLEDGDGWRGFVITNPGGDRLILHFHHSHCDALGALRFVYDWLQAYGNPERVPPARSLLDAHDPVIGREYGRMQSAKADLKRIVKYFTTRPKPLASALAHRAKQRRAHFCSIRLSVEESSAVFNKACALGVTVNSFLLARLYEVVFEVNETLRGRCAGVIRIAVPVNMRASSALRASNASSMVFLDRRVEDRSVLEKSISAEMANVRRYGTGHALLQVLRVAAAVPGGMRTVVGNGCAVTAVLSNLGRILNPHGEDRFAFGNMALNGVEFYPPIRAGTKAAFSALTYAGCLTLSLRGDGNALDLESTEKLLQRLREKLF